MKIILASASPRRRELLTQMGLEFDVCPSRKEEVITKETPAEAVMELAEQKAAEIAELAAREQPEEEILVIGADTVVVKDHQILGKPGDEEEAVRMLHRLSGDTHQVYTGVCLIFLAGEERTEKVFYEATDVCFYPMSDQEILDYVRTGDPMDKAGAYGIQGLCGKYIRGIRGDYNNVVGLPIARLYREMKESGYCGNEQGRIFR